MRFAKLVLERYGRFEGCELDFHLRGPDFHLIYGPNEAGKSTSLSAVSDLLFGFPARSPYNFIFDYSLLRVGAVIEENGRTLACRRRKSGASTLLEADDQAISDGDLLSMLRGQTRETFTLSFSLDQKALREGGQAILKAKDDVGQALFAAGSGLTKIADQLKRIESEADEIWGRRAKATRTYTRAERELEAGLRAVRDASLKPKSWLDAQSAKEETKQRLEKIGEYRTALLLENQQLQRLRRVAGNVRIREDLMSQVKDAAETVELPEAAETAAHTAIQSADQAKSKKAIAERLLAELGERAAQQTQDTEVLTQADRIDALVIEFGGVTKAAKDLISLEGQRATAAKEIERHRKRAGVTEGGTFPADVVAQLRKHAREHAADIAALEEIEASYAEIEDRRKPFEEVLQVDLEEDVRQTLADAVDFARRLGADADDRCASARQLVDGAAVDLERAMARLRPWTGSEEELAGLPDLGEAELNRVRGVWTSQSDAIEKEEATALRLDAEVERLNLQIALASTGSAISPQELSDSRNVRLGSWLKLRGHLLNEKALVDPLAGADAFEHAVAAADDLADRRFSLAEESARLAGLEASRAERVLEAHQARQRAEAAKKIYANSANEWQRRLLSLGLPELEPGQLISWLGERDDALRLRSDLVRLRADAERLRERRRNAIAGLCQALKEDESETELMVVLTRAERKLAEMGAKADESRRARDSLDQLDRDRANLERRRTATQGRIEPRRAAWESILSGAGISLDIATADLRLSAIDELRQVEEQLAELDRRIEGIRRDAAAFTSELSDVSRHLRMEITGDEGRMVQAIRKRYEQARAAKLILDEIEKEQINRRSELGMADAELAAALQAIAPVMEITAASDTTTLLAALDASQSLRKKREALKGAEAAILRDGDGMALADLAAMVLSRDPDELAARTESIDLEMQEVNAKALDAATEHGEVSRAFAELDRDTGVAADAAFDAEQARAEMTIQAEAYILKRTQAVTLRWAIERYRERNQDPLLIRASEIFSTLTLGRYSALRVDIGEGTPRLFGLTNDGRAAIEVDAMSEGTTDQLFLALRLAAVEHSVDAGVCLPFLADDLFVNFDDERAEAGFRVLAQLAQKTQVLFFTHHAHLAAIARRVIGEEGYSECSLL